MNWSRHHDHDDCDRARDAGLSGVHQGDARDDLGRHHEAGVHGQVLPRRTRRDTGEAGTPMRMFGPEDRRGATRSSRSPIRRAGWSWAGARSTTPRWQPRSEAAITWEIDPREDGVCLVTLVHDQLEHSPITAGSVSGEGWMDVLSGLKTLLETGQPMVGAARPPRVLQFSAACESSTPRSSRSWSWPPALRRRPRRAWRSSTATTPLAASRPRAARSTARGSRSRGVRGRRSSRPSATCASRTRAACRSTSGQAGARSRSRSRPPGTSRRGWRGTTAGTPSPRSRTACESCRARGATS